MQKHKTNIFDDLSSLWWKDSGAYKILHQINDLRIQYLAEKCYEHFNISSLDGIDIIDVGCGGGIASCALSKLSANVCGIDSSGSSINEAILHAKESGIEVNYHNLTPEEYIKSFSDKKYDVVFSFETIEHVDDLKSFVESCLTMLKPRGLFVMSTINRNVKSYLLAIFLAENVLKWIPKGMHEYEKLVKPSEVNSILKENGFKISEMKGLSMNIFNGKWYISDDISVNYFMKIQRV